MEEKTLYERYKDDILSDNTQIEICKQCKDCKFNDDGTVWSNHYTKSSCQKYPYPSMKPPKVIDNKADCPYRETE